MRIHSSVLLALTLFTLMSAEKTSTPLASIQELRKKFEKTEASKQVPPKTKTIPAQAQQAQKAAPISTIPSISITPDNPVSCTQEPCLDNSKLLLQLNHNFTTLTHQALLQSPSFEPFLRYDTQHLLDFSEGKLSPQQDADEIELLREFIISKGVECGIPDMAARMDKLDKKIVVLKPVFEKIKPEHFNDFQAYQFANNEALKTCLGFRIWTYVSPYKIFYQTNAGLSLQAYETVELMLKNFPSTDLAFIGGNAKNPFNIDILMGERPQESIEANQEKQKIPSDLIICSEPLLPLSFTAGPHGYKDYLEVEMGTQEYQRLLKSFENWDKKPSEFLKFSQRMRKKFVNENEFFGWVRVIEPIKQDFEKHAIKELKGPLSYEKITTIFKHTPYKDTQFEYDQEQYHWMSQWAPALHIMLNYIDNFKKGNKNPQEEYVETDDTQTPEEFSQKIHTDKEKNKLIQKSCTDYADFIKKTYIDPVNLFRNLAFSGLLVSGFDKSDYKNLFGLAFEYACRKALGSMNYLLFIGNRMWDYTIEPDNYFFACLDNPKKEIISCFAITESPCSSRILELKTYAQERIAKTGVSSTDNLKGNKGPRAPLKASSKQIMQIAQEFALKPALEKKPLPSHS